MRRTNKRLNLPASLLIASSAVFATACLGDDAGLDSAFGEDDIDQFWTWEDTTNDWQTPYTTLAFDGSKRFSMWLESLNFARVLSKKFNKPIHFTYFVTSKFYDSCGTTPDLNSEEARQDPCLVIAGTSGDERIRWALTQMAINEGHEIASRGTDYNENTREVESTRAAWRPRLKLFLDLMEAYLAEAGQVTPDWSNIAPLSTDPASVMFCGTPPQTHEAYEEANINGDSIYGPSPLNDAREAWLNQKADALLHPDLGGTDDFCVALDDEFGVLTRACRTDADCVFLEGDPAERPTSCSDFKGDGLCYEATCDGLSNNGGMGICLPRPNLYDYGSGYDIVGHRFHYLEPTSNDSDTPMASLAALHLEGYLYDASGNAAAQCAISRPHWLQNITQGGAKWLDFFYQQRLTWTDMYTEIDNGLTADKECGHADANAWTMRATHSEKYWKSEETGEGNVRWLKHEDYADAEALAGQMLWQFERYVWFRDEKHRAKKPPLNFSHNFSAPKGHYDGSASRDFPLGDPFWTQMKNVFELTEARANDEWAALQFASFRDILFASGGAGPAAD